MEKACILCGSNTFETLFTAQNPDFPENFKIERCTQCGLKRSEPLEDVSKYYTESQYFAKKDSAFNKIKKAFSHFLKVRPLESIRSHPDENGIGSSRVSTSKSKGRLLDAGCSDGEFLKLLDPKKWELYGVEPYGSPEETNPNFKILKETFEKTTLPDKFFDVITFWHVMEHVDNPMEVLKECHRIIKNDGLLFISVPNSGSIGFKWFQNKWFALYPPIHIHHYDIKTLSKILEKSGFEVTKVDRFTSDYATFVIAQSLLNTLGFPPNYFYKMLRGNTNNKTLNYLTLLAALAVMPVALFFLLLEALDKNGSSVINIYARPKD